MVSFFSIRGFSATKTASGLRPRRRRHKPDRAMRGRAGHLPFPSALLVGTPRAKKGNRFFCRGGEGRPREVLRVHGRGKLVGFIWRGSFLDFKKKAQKTEAPAKYRPTRGRRIRPQGRLRNRAGISAAAFAAASAADANQGPGCGATAIS